MFDLKAKDIRKFLQGIMGSKIKWFTPPSFLHARCQFVCPHVQYIGNLTPTLDHRKIFIVFLHEYTGNDFFFALSFRLYSEKIVVISEPENDQHSVHTIPSDPSRGIFPPNVRTEEEAGKLRPSPSTKVSDPGLPLFEDIY